MGDKKQDRCWRCRYASARFRWGRETWHVCLHPSRAGDHDPREDAMPWYGTCGMFEANPEKESTR